MATNRTQAQRLIKCGAKWVHQYDTLLSNMNEVGDLANWSRLIEKDMVAVSKAIQERIKNK